MLGAGEATIQVLDLVAVAETTPPGELRERGLDGWPAGRDEIDQTLPAIVARRAELRGTEVSGVIRAPSRRVRR